MSLTVLEMQHLCKLAKLDPDLKLQELFVSQCGDILQYMERLEEVDTNNIEPLYSPISHVASLREDVAIQHLSKEDILSNAPKTDGNYFIVPRIVEGK